MTEKCKRCNSAVELGMITIDGANCWMKGDCVTYECNGSQRHVYKCDSIECDNCGSLSHETTNVDTTTETVVKSVICNDCDSSYDLTFNAVGIYLI